MGGLQSGSCGSRPQKIGNHRSEGNQGHQPRNVLFFQGSIHQQRKKRRDARGKSFFLVCFTFSLLSFVFCPLLFKRLWRRPRSPESALGAVDRRRIASTAQRKKKTSEAPAAFRWKKKTKKKQKNNKKTMTATASAELSVIHGGTVPES